MAKNLSGGDLAQRIQHLLETRQQHADALAQIEATLDQIGAALGTGHNGRRKPGRSPAAASIAGATVTQPKKKRRRGRGAFAMTAEEFVLGFVKANKSPTTAQINAAWKNEGRGHTADNTLSKLARERKLKRTPLGEGIRGSKYSPA